MGLRVCGVCGFKLLINIAKLRLPWLSQLCSLQRSMRVHFPSFCQRRLLQIIFIFPNLMGKKWYRVVFICICMIASETEHLFIRLLANLVLPLRISNSLPILSLLSFFLLICTGSLHISGIFL